MYIREASIAKFGRRDSIWDMLEECMAGLETAPDLILFGSMGFEVSEGQGNSATLVADRLGFPETKCMRIDTSSSSGAALVHYGAQLLSAGRYKNILAVAAERFSSMDSADTTSLFASVLSPSERLSGCTMPAAAALIWNIYASKYHAEGEALMSVSLKNHRNGSKNPIAHIRRVYSPQEYLSSRIVSTPLRVLDCAPVSDGACAAILSSSGAVRIAGLGQGCDRSAFAERADDPMAAVGRAAAEAYLMASVSSEDIDFAELHDAFTPFEIMETEALGFFKPGEGAGAALAGLTDENGKIPVNLSGGLKARGHPVGVSGLAQMVEIFMRLTGTGNTQAEGKRALALSVGGAIANNFVTVLEAA